MPEAVKQTAKAFPLRGRWREAPNEVAHGMAGSLA